MAVIQLNQDTQMDTTFLTWPPNVALSLENKQKQNKKKWINASCPLSLVEV